MIKLVIHGRPVSQKNDKHPAINRRTGKTFIVSDGKVKAWHRAAEIQLRNQWANRPPIKATEVRLDVYLGKGQSMDFDNATCAPMDALQRAGVIYNDNSIDAGHTYRYKDQRDRPRCEITILEWTP